MSDPLPDLPAAAALRWAIWCRLLAAGTATPPPVRTTRAANPAVLETVREMVSAGERVTGVTLGARIGVSQVTASAQLRALVAAGQLRRVGATSSLRYLLPEAAPEAAAALSPVADDDGEPRRTGPSLALPEPATERAVLDHLASVGRPASPIPTRPGLWSVVAAKDSRHWRDGDNQTWRQVVGLANTLRLRATPPLPPFILPDLDPPSGSSGSSLEQG